MIPPREKRFLKTALALAPIWSKDPSTKVCAVAVGGTPNQVAFGYNGFPPGVEDTPERLNDRETKLRLTLHAEENALLNATFPVRFLFVTRHPCTGCALRILASRTVALVWYVKDPEFEARWADDLGVAAAILRDGDIRLIGVDPRELEDDGDE